MSWFFKISHYHLWVYIFFLYCFDVCTYFLPVLVDYSYILSLLKE